MAVQDAIAKIVAGNALDGVRDLIGEFHQSPEQKAQDELALQQLAEHEDEITAARDTALATVQGQNIQAEAKSGDKYVERARPTFLYLMYVVIFYSFIIQPIFLMGCAVAAVMHGGLKWSEVALVVKPLEIPGALYELFAAGYLGYAAVRSGDKFSAAMQSVAGLPGDSQVHIEGPLGFKVHVGNNSSAPSGLGKAA